MCSASPATRQHEGVYFVQEALSVYLRVGDRRPSRQDCRPDFRCHPRRLPEGRSLQPRGLRNADRHRPGRHRRRNHHQGLRRFPDAGARRGRLHRLRQRALRLRLQHLRGDLQHQQAVGRHRHGRGHRRRRRPGHDVRLRHQRKRRTHADANFAGAQADASSLTEVRKNGTLPYLRPDGKSQVTVEYDENHKPVRIDAVVISTPALPRRSTTKSCAPTS